MVAPDAADVVVTDQAGGGSGWRLTDRAGAPLTDSEWVRQGVAGESPTVDVQLRDRTRILASGRVEVRRSIAATVAVALSTAGPLIEMAVVGADPATDAVDDPVPSPTGSVIASARGHAAFVGRVARAAVTYRQWGIARLDARAVSNLLGGGPVASRLEWHSPPPDHFWADPAVVAADEADACWVFVEELAYATGRGHIRALWWDGRVLHRGAVVYATDHHLSYPQIQRVGGRWVATVETCAAANPMMTFDRPGDPWRVAADLPALPPHMADAVVEFDVAGSPVRVFATDAATSPDAVYVEHRHVDGLWSRDPSRTYVDVRSARGGGTWDSDLGVRAVQDCAGSYGMALSLVPDQGWRGARSGAVRAHLDGESVPLGSWRPAGVHTLAWTPDQEHVWLDGWRRRGSAVGGYRRLVERRHLASCKG